MKPDTLEFSRIGCAACDGFGALSRVQTAGVDYRVTTRLRQGSDVAVIAIHGGSIEPGTSEIATAIAGADHNLYLFEGIRAAGNFKYLHLTSNDFDEPACLNMVSRCIRVVSIHGCAGTQKLVYMGGLDLALKERVAQYLRAGDVTVAPDRFGYLGDGPTNPCNLGAGRGGVQLEITRALRLSPDRDCVVRAVRLALA